MSKKTMHIHALKPKIDSMLGIKYVLQKGGYFRITAIDDTSIFMNEGDLRVGHEVIQVNGTDICELSSEKLKTLLASLGEHVVFVVRTTWSATFTPQIVQTKTSTVHNGSSNGSNGINVRRFRFIKNFYKGKIPPFLAGLGVPMTAWKRIHQALTDDLLPAIEASYQMEEIKKQEMEMFAAKKAKKEFELLSTNTKHDGKVFRMTQTATALADSVSFIASNVLSLTNALLQQYGLLANLLLESYELPKYSETKQTDIFRAVRVTGIEFIPIPSLEDGDGFTISCSRSEDGSVLTEPGVDTTRWC
eukprot:scaffold6966_cov112-Cylindrotheca_fusiformis.AAC.26